MTARDIVKLYVDIIEHFYLHNGGKVRNTSISRETLKKLGLARKNDLIYRKRNGKLSKDVRYAYLIFRWEELDSDLMKIM